MHNSPLWILTFKYSWTSLVCENCSSLFRASQTIYYSWTSPNTSLFASAWLSFSSFFWKRNYYSVAFYLGLLNNEEKDAPNDYLICPKKEKICWLLAWLVMIHYTEAFICPLHSHFLILWAKAGRSHISEHGAVCIQNDIPTHLSGNSQMLKCLLDWSGNTEVDFFSLQGKHLGRESETRRTKIK